MLYSLILLTSSIIVAAQYVFTDPPYFPKSDRLLTVPAYMNWWRVRSSSSSNEPRCSRCRYLRSSCSDVPELYECSQPKIENFISKYGCKSAVVNCGNSDAFVTLETINGKVLAEGKRFQKYVKCERNKKWVTRDIYNNDVSFRTLRCVKKGSLGQNYYKMKPKSQEERKLNFNTTSASLKS